MKFLNLQNQNNKTHFIKSILRINRVIVLPTATQVLTIPHKCI